jgi:hypothetical protein
MNDLDRTLLHETGMKMHLERFSNFNTDNYQKSQGSLPELLTLVLPQPIHINKCLPMYCAVTAFPAGTHVSSFLFFMVPANVEMKFIRV